MTDRHARLLCEALLRDAPNALPDTRRARLRAHCVQLAWVYMAIIDEVGQRLVKGSAPSDVADQVRPIIAAVLDDLQDVPDLLP